ncbi:MAG TPA: hypothetical protein PL176_03715 [Kiritimatiellia bacterium]|nr:hypothetical protein [Kiritimatiellia bacterium]
MTYHHTGIPVFEKLEDMIFIEPLKVWITEADKHPYKVEFLYFEPDSPMAAAIQDETHVAILSRTSRRRYWARACCGLSPRSRR